MRLRYIISSILLVLTATAGQAQISIGGDVYGGGKQGAVGTDNTTATAETADDKVTLKTEVPQDVTNVTVISGTVRTVFGGGENGRTYGNTKVQVSGSGATIGGTSWIGSSHGGLFGGGDGAAAYVFGNSTVTISNGHILQNVYGGGNQAPLVGSTTVSLEGGDIAAPGVFGGARMADIYGSSYVVIDSTKLQNDLLVNYIYGGNDISGIIKTSTNTIWAWATEKRLPTGFKPLTPSVDNTWNAYINITNPDVEAGTKKKIFIGQVYGGGNGDYATTTNYYEAKTDGGYTFHFSDKTVDVPNKPEIEKTYLELKGGTIAYVYGGGNAATVTENTTICIKNTSEVVTEIKDAGGNNAITNSDRMAAMGLNSSLVHVESDEFQFARVFGGNNKAAMAIQPDWNLLEGGIRDLYSGGNEGAMTSKEGLLLEIPATSAIKVDNVYGGCRRADVHPAVSDDDLYEIQLSTPGYNFPEGLAARVLIKGGDINNVYGGNDISGRVYGGNAVGVYKSIRGSVYGAGNGSYPYTDNADLGQTNQYRDYYYNGGSATDDDGLASAKALNAFRPNAEQVSLYVKGTEGNPTLIGGAIYVGGNSATLTASKKKDPMVELKIGPYVIADNVFLGNNGENMVKSSLLQQFAGSVDGKDFSKMDLTKEKVFAEYMEGCAMPLMPSVVFDDDYKDAKKQNKVAYSTLFGSLYCGGNVGSMTKAGKTTLNFAEKVVVFEKVVGGCNNARVPASTYNAAYEGGVLGDADKDGNKLELNFRGLKIQPKRWKTNTDGTKELVWNTIDAVTGENVDPVTSGLPVDSMSNDDDLNRRFKDGNIYGGCCESGIVNGNVIINLEANIIDRDSLFDEVQTDGMGEEISLYGTDKYKITKRHTGVILGQQGMDVLGKALNVFGGGKGEGTEIWGSTRINLKRGYVFQIFGGSEKGVIGKSDASGDYTFNGKTYKYNPAYSCTINLCGEKDGVSKRADSSEDMAEAEFIYGGGFEGPIAGNTIVNLGQGRIFNSFAGSCNADILGHTETYIGRDSVDVDGNDVAGFPWIRDYTYGGNDLGGRIMSEGDFTGRVREATLPMVYGYTEEETETGTVKTSKVLKAAAYTEYLQGRAQGIFGGCYGTYDYSGDAELTTTVGKTDFTKPRTNSAFVNFRPTYEEINNGVASVYGAGQGYSGETERDLMQKRSYVLIDIPQNINKYDTLQVFGAGAWGGVGMEGTPAQAKANPDDYSAIIDLVSGEIAAAYGASYKEGFTRRTMVNVPTGSTIKIGSIFGGGYGVDSNAMPCDAYEANVNYNSGKAHLIYNPAKFSALTGAIYGGNNSYRRTLYGKVNINAPVIQDNVRFGMSKGTVYGAGYGENTWSQYTEVNLNEGAEVYEVYGGGQNGKVLNKASVDAMKTAAAAADKPVTIDLSLGTGYADNGLENDLAIAVNNPYVAEINGKKYNTNVHINRGATVGTRTESYAINGGYAYGGGLGDSLIVESGDVYGTTYIELRGGRVWKDVYAAGTRGAVFDKYHITGDGAFTAGTTAYIEGGTVRNVYGGGWKGDVGYHDSETTATTTDVLGETTVIIGIRNDQATKPASADYGFYKGIPAIQRNAYSGGEGGAVFGTANLIMNNGAIGYEYDGHTESPKGLPVGYRIKVNDETYTKGDSLLRLRDCGNLFGGGYDVRSSVDFANVTMWGGVVRNSMHGGGEIATIGRGAIQASGEKNSVRTLTGFYKAGKTNVTMYNGHVQRNVFGGGKGYNIYGYGEQGTLYTDGYTFGSTEVNIRGGEIGTDEGLADGYGNVFGGGDIGYVWGESATTEKTMQNVSTGSPLDKKNNTDHIYYYGPDGKLSEDCKVIVSPYLQVRAAEGVTINGTAYPQYAYVKTDDLNTLPKKNDDGSYTGTDWLKLYTGAGDKDSDDTEERGVHIHNAVFGGGNVTSNSDSYADAPTVFGNTTATLYDVFHRDFITVGTEHTGGLYGGGNLSMVAGYRELNITNYGTDYYGLKQTITIDEYRGLSNRERAYFQLEYECTAHSETQTIDGQEVKGITIDGTFYKYNDKLSEEDYLKLANSTKEGVPALAKASFTPYGFCSIYAGRLLNTIQRADFCGVYGSRMVLQGSKDRVADVGEDIDYTINRVGELSLNQQHSVRTADTGTDKTHGNYFGIYSVVNHLGNLTSDVRFGENYVDGKGVTYSDSTYYMHKSYNHSNSKRNNGSSVNQVALASGVFLELTTEKSTTETKDYGYVTGVVELDLINVGQDVGGGFVYAKNEHRVPKYYPNKSNVILSRYNSPDTLNNVPLRDEARTYKRYRYADPTHNTENNPLWADDNWTESEDETVISGDNAHVYQTMEWQTSGNFIHPLKRIVDDCYPTNNAYTIGQTPYSEAHYWYVKGEVYVYDQKVSAYTGSANAYSKEVHLPLTITAASHGQLQLLNVKPNLYAYYTDNNGARVKIGSLDSNDKPIEKVTVNNESNTYGLNDVVSWWDWQQMSASDRQYFVAETFVNCDTVTVTENSIATKYEPGTYVMDATDFDAFKTAFNSHSITIQNHLGDPVTNVGTVFRSSNNLGHNSGYVLTFDMNSPKVWDDYYTATSSTSKISKEEYERRLSAATTETARQETISAWRMGPTFTPTVSGIYGKQKYEAGDIVTKSTFDVAAEGQEKMKPAYVAISATSYTYGGTPKSVNIGTAISKTEYDAIGSAYQSAFKPAWVCTTTLKLTNDNQYLLYGDLKTAEEITGLKAIENKLVSDEDIDAAVTPAYICTEDGTYGGQQFNKGTNYSAIQAWCSLPAEDRQKFNYNYDALDLLTDTVYLKVDPTVTASPSHDRTVQAYHAPYTDIVKVEYNAVFKKKGVDVELNGANLTDGQTITNEEFETIRNDKRHYTHVKTDHNGDNVYIAKDNFVYLGTPYGKGQVVNIEVYNANSSHVEIVNVSEAGSHYYCYEDYTKADGTPVSKGKIISESDFKNEAVTPNHQQYFVIQGQEPTETTTLYVSRESNIKDLMKEKIITVVYQYTYYEDEDDGSVKMTNELHVINIHLELESGVPQIGQLTPPATVLPGTAVGIRRPDVNPGLYEVLTNGWELFETEEDALHHRNGKPFDNNSTPVYWYQNQKNWVAFYSKTYLGKTYSNPVLLSVANYHDLDAVMKDKEHHMYVDRSDVDRASKIYIDNRACSSDSTKSELDLLKDFFDLSLQKMTGETAGHTALDSHVRGGRNLEFFLQSDVSPKKYTSWTPIGNNDVKGITGECFEGTLHGDGYTISGLSNSLFNHLCGEVYNLGVTGSFTGAGIAESGDGYVENCWIKTTGTPATTGDGTHYAVFANPNRGTGDSRGQVQVENCYYPKSNTYPAPPAGYAHGAARQMDDRDFNNGEVAYNLNGFYLKKRFYHGTNVSTGTPYRYLQPNADGSLPETMSTGYYPNTYAIYQPDIKVAEGETIPYMGYVESRFYDGDFHYASTRGNGVPEGNDIRMRTITTTEGTGDNAVVKETVYYVPIWPDDYIFFGQALTYGHMGNRQHQDHPSHITKSNERIQTNENGNRVYRAPAYYRSKKMDMAHFNPYAVFAETKKDEPTVIAYKGLTAIDFTGKNDLGYQEKWSGDYFYPPLLDDDGLTDFHNEDLTRNLLVYTTAGTTTDGVVGSYLKDDYKFSESHPAYHSVALWDYHSDKVRGHWVQKGEDGRYMAHNDHLLVDKNDFNAPIGYQFDNNHRMWYQRNGDDMNYVDGVKGWEVVSLPFESEMVTTSGKGEISHFYEGSAIGHEYWLREYQGGTVKSNLLDAEFAKPAAGTTSKTYDNKFLWFYYYSQDNQRDNNEDIYQTYYRESHTYDNYPRVQAGVPYLIGFPGATYYEFDLSGEWTPEDRYQNKGIASPGRQTITFASKQGTQILVSDDETGHKSADGYTFRANYLNHPENEAASDAKPSFLLDADGESFVKTTDKTLGVSAFRPYFVTGTVSASARTRAVNTSVEKIIFGEDDTRIGMSDYSQQREAPGESLTIYGRDHRIVLESNLRSKTDIRILTTAGILVRRLSIEPGETKEVPVNLGGIYIVKTTDNRYFKKIAVK